MEHFALVPKKQSCHHGSKAHSRVRQSLQESMAIGTGPPEHRAFTDNEKCVDKS